MQIAKTVQEVHEPNKVEIVRPVLGLAGCHVHKKVAIGRYVTKASLRHISHEIPRYCAFIECRCGRLWNACEGTIL